jgi:hypothetical protein
MPFDPKEVAAGYDEYRGMLPFDGRILDAGDDVFSADSERLVKSSRCTPGWSNHEHEHGS